MTMRVPTNYSRTYKSVPEGTIPVGSTCKMMIIVLATLLT